MKKSVLKKWCILLVLLSSGLMMVAEEGGEAKEGEPKKEKPKIELVDMSYSGKLTKVEGKKGFKYMLETADGKIALPTKKDGEKENFDYTPFEEKNITVKGKGVISEKVTKKGPVKTVRLMKLLEVTEGEATPPAEKPAE